MNTYLITGLGNPGIDYKLTRHNVGFLFIEYLKSKIDSEEFKLEKKFKAELSVTKIENNKAILAMPQTFMNNSGESVQQLKAYYNISDDHIIIVHDDLDIDFGEYKIQLTKGPRQHNGILSIENHLNTNQFYKVRIGVENRGELRKLIKGRDFVLSKFTQDEQKKLVEVFEKIYKDLLNILTI